MPGSGGARSFDPPWQIWCLQRALALNLSAVAGRSLRPRDEQRWRQRSSEPDRGSAGRWAAVRPAERRVSGKGGGGRAGRDDAAEDRSVPSVLIYPRRKEGQNARALNNQSAVVLTLQILDRYTDMPLVQVRVLTLSPVGPVLVAMPRALTAHT